MATPVKIDVITIKICVPVAIASCIKSKQTTLSMTPPAKLNNKLTVLLESLRNNAPIKPPSPVPTTPEIAVGNNIASFFLFLQQVYHSLAL